MTKRWNRWIGAGLSAAAAVVAVAAGATAVNAASSGDGHHLLSSDDVARQLAGLDSVASKQGTIRASGTTATVNGADIVGIKIVATQGGDVVMQCKGNTPQLLRWVPNTGFRTDGPDLISPDVVRIRFESDTADDVTLNLGCEDGHPAIQPGD